MPNRSASMSTIVVALATSTPTSITVVDTRTSISPAAKARIVRSFSSGGSRPWSAATAARAAGRRSSSATTSSTAASGGAGGLGHPAVELASSYVGSRSPCSSSSPLIRGQTT